MLTNLLFGQITTKEREKGIALEETAIKFIIIHIKEVPPRADLEVQATMIKAHINIQATIKIIQARTRVLLYLLCL